MFLFIDFANWSCLKTEPYLEPRLVKRRPAFLPKTELYGLVSLLLDGIVISHFKLCSPIWLTRKLASVCATWPLCRLRQL